jgi:hypothetical protein
VHRGARRGNALRIDGGLPAGAQLIKNGDLDYPELMASCRSVTNQIVMNTAKVR